MEDPASASFNTGGALDKNSSASFTADLAERVAETGVTGCSSTLVDSEGCSISKAASTMLLIVRVVLLNRYLVKRKKR